MTGLQEHPGNAPSGSGAPSDRTTNPPHGSADRARASRPVSCCQPLAQIIEVKLAQGVSGVRIWQDLVADHGFAGSFGSAKCYLRRLGRSRPLPVRRMECLPGQEARVGPGTGLRPTTGAMWAGQLPGGNNADDHQSARLAALGPFSP